MFGHGNTFDRGRPVIFPTTVRYTLHICVSRGWAAKPDGDPPGPDGGSAGGGGLQPPGRGGVPGLHLGHRGRHQLAAGACCPHAARHPPPSQAAQGPPLPHLCQQVSVHGSQLADSSAAKPKRGRIKI
jgi:hypothetical protein